MARPLGVPPRRERERGNRRRPRHLRPRSLVRLLDRPRGVRGKTACSGRAKTVVDNMNGATRSRTVGTVDTWSSRFARRRRVFKRNIDKLTVLAADKGYDRLLLRQLSRSGSVRRVICHREFDWYGIAHSFFRNDTNSAHRSNVAFRVFAQNPTRASVPESGSPSSANAL